MKLHININIMLKYFLILIYCFKIFSLCYNDLFFFNLIKNILNMLI